MADQYMSSSVLVMICTICHSTIQVYFESHSFPSFVPSLTHNRVQTLTLGMSQDQRKNETGPFCIFIICNLLYIYMLNIYFIIHNGSV